MVKFFHKISRSALVTSRQAFLSDFCRGKSVLHIGCVDSGLTKVRFENGELLHAQLLKVSARVVGVDIDEGGIELMRSFGIRDLHVADIENGLNLDEKFDVVVAGEVIEHLSNSGKLIENSAQIMKDDGVFIITAPNAFCLTTIIRLFRGIETVHEDHVSYFSYATMRTFLSRYGLYIVNFAFYSDITRKNGLKRIMKGIYHVVLSVFPQFGEGIVVVSSRVVRTA
ncbi:methyltransferase domain-containing protein [Sphingoaurantiacus capsulatus]|uniref:Methyltransferase domain-containing protein n=1 Tax=Sphingoaurantiacus capsulatus TaxID=1771310 RepID=A0ABV7XCX0_9SPHN